ncbi:hypothetical protein [Chryseobacterium sp.]|uniref:hypothetical protein n=1 Tax=Chryseobacterium sp. TaxID=1871047 RepID=UPI00321AAB47
MSSLYFIFVLILMFTFQYVSGKGRATGGMIDENSDINEDCIGNQNYCCNSAVAKTNNYLEENHELIVNSPISSDDNVLFGPLLIIISLLVLRAFSKRAEE